MSDTRLAAILRGPRWSTYTTYAIGCTVVWAIIWILLATLGSSHTVHVVRMVFGGWVIGWLSATIARAFYPPPKRRLFGGPPATSHR